MVNQLRGVGCSSGFQYSDGLLEGCLSPSLSPRTQKSHLDEAHLQGCLETRRPENHLHIHRLENRLRIYLEEGVEG